MIETSTNSRRCKENKSLLIRENKTHVFSLGSSKSATLFIYERDTNKNNKSQLSLEKTNHYNLKNCMWARTQLYDRKEFNITSFPTLNILN